MTYHPDMTIVAPHNTPAIRCSKQYACKNCCIVKRKMTKCSGCKLVRYCSTSCQRNDWKFHKYQCCFRDDDCDSCIPESEDGSEMSWTDVPEIQISLDELVEID